MTCNKTWPAWVGLAALFGILLVVQPAKAELDNVGAAYPDNCPASIVNDPALLARTTVTYADLGPVNGLRGLNFHTEARDYNTINNRLRGWVKADTERHELCHVVWHGENWPGHNIKGRDAWTH